MKNFIYICFTAIIILLNLGMSAQTVYTVTKTTDPDPFLYPYDFNDSLCSSEMYGTLQWAIRKSNDTEGQCQIVFNILGQAPHTILLGNYFPQITNSVIIDATTQAGYTVGEPSVIIDGQNLISSAFYVFEADNVEIKGFRINRMKSAGVVLHFCHDVIISDNIISLPNANYNVTKLGFNRIKLMQCSNIYIYNNVLDAIVDGIPTPGPYNYGIAVYGTTNCFIGDALTNKSNSIVNCYNGVYVDALSQAIKISGNIINGSSTGISLTSGSNNNKKSPMILRYEEGVLKGVGIAGDVVEVFGSTGAEKSLVYLGSAATDSFGDWTLNVTTNYNYFICTATDENNNTSKFSNAVLINPSCMLPTNLSASTGVATSHTLTWDGISGTVYNVAIGVKNLSPLDSNWLVSYNQTTADSIIISDLDQNTEYEYYVNSNCGSEISYWAGPLEFNYIASVQSTGLLTMFQNADSIDLDDFLYARKVTGATQYQFNVVQVDSGVNQIITKDDNYFSLLELQNNEAYYDKEYRIKVRTIQENDTTDWGNVCSLRTIDVQRYYYGRIFLKLSQGNMDVLYPYDTTFVGEPVVNIDGFQQFNDVFNIMMIKQTFGELLNDLPNLAPIFSLHFKYSTSTDSIISFLVATGSFEYVEKDPIVKMYYNDPLYNNSALPLCYECNGQINQWHMQVDYLNSLAATNIVNNNNIVTIAVVDDAFRIDHKDLQDNIYINSDELPENIIIDILEDYDTDGNGIIDADNLIDYCNNILPGQINSLVDIFNHSGELGEIFNGVTDDDNVYIDDLFGWDATDGDNFPYPGFIAIPNHPQFNHSFSHGTHVASIAGGVTNNSFGIASISDNHARIIPIKTKLDNDPHSPTLHFALDGIVYAVAIHADIVNMSFGFAVNEETSFNTYQELIDNAHEELGIVFIAAMGNDNNQFITNAPACIENVVAVGATNVNNDIAAFSTLGSHMDFWAPGEHIVAAYSASDDSYICQSGTSMACPNTAALWALMLSINPEASFEDIYNCIRDNVSLNINDWDPIIQGGFGLIDPLASVLCYESLPPLASINTDAQIICANNNFLFNSTDLSNPASSWNWYCDDPFVIFSTPNVESTLINFPELGIYNVSLEVCDDEGIQCNTTSIEVLVQDPSIEILNGTDFYVCDGIDARVFLNIIGTPPFSFEVICNGSTIYSFIDIWENNFSFQIETSEASINDIFSLELINFEDLYCDGIGQSASFRISQCLRCGGAYNQIIHMITVEEDSNAGILFADGVPGVVNSPLFLSASTAGGLFEGNFSISDFWGNPVLSTKSSRIFYTRDMPEYFELTNNIGDFGFSYSSLQGSLILPDPTGAENNYYVFNIKSHNELPNLDGIRCRRVTILDADNIPDPGSYIIVDVTPLQDSNDDRELMTSCMIMSEPGYWIVTKRLEGFNIYSLTAESQVPQFVSTQTIGTVLPMHFGYMTFDLTQELLAVSYDQSNLIELYHFNRDANFTGNRLSLISTFNVDSPGAMEFSPNSEYLYVCSNNNSFNTFDIFQIQTSLPNNSTLIYSEPSTWVTAAVGGMRLCPDGSIYVQCGGAGNIDIAIISNPNNAGINCNFMQNEIQLNVNNGSKIPQRVPSSQILFNIAETDCENTLFLENIGGVGPFTYLWSNGETLPEITVDEPGVYTVSVTSVEGCIRVEDYYYNGGLQIDVVSISNNCLSGGMITFDLSGGTGPYSAIVFRQGLSYNEWIIEDISSSIVQSNLPNGSYTLHVIDQNSCEKEFSFEIENSLQINLQSDYTIICEGESVNILSQVSSEALPITYNWSNDDHSQNITVFPSETTTYTLTATDSDGCSGEEFITILVNETNPNAGEDQIICNEESVTLSATGGISYTWSNGITNGTSFIPTATGTYTVTATDINGCTATDNVTITVNSPEITMPTDLLTCYGQGITIGGTNIVSNGTPPFTYAWSNGVNTPSQIVTPLVTTSFDLTVTDANDCTATGTVVVTVNPQLTVTADANAFPNCPGEQTILTAHPLGGSPDYTYQWSNSLGTNQTAEVFPSINSNYSVVVSDVNGCTAETNVSTEIAYSINSILSENACPNDNNGFITVVINANTLNSFPNSVHWNSDFTSVFTQTSSNTYETTVSGLAPGIYNYDVTDALGCHITGSVDIEVYSITHYDPVVSISCPNANTGSIVPNISNASEPFEYLWSNGFDTENIYSLPSGNYELTFTYGNNCVDISTYFVDEEPEITLSVSNVSADYNDSEIGSALISFIYTDYAVGNYSVSLTNHVDYSYSWTDYNIGFNLQTSSLPDGLYDVTLNSPNGCAYTEQFSIDEVMEYAINSCPEVNSGRINLVFYTYGETNTLTSLVSWSNGENTAIVLDGYYEELEQYKYHTDIAGLAPGTYTYSITDAWGNFITHEVTVGVFTEPIITSVSTPSCISPSNGTLGITVTNALDPYYYNWSNSETSNYLENLASGNYMVTVTYATNCEYVASFNVGENPEVGVNITQVLPDFNGNDGMAYISYDGLFDGEYSLHVTSPNYDYTYNFNNSNPAGVINHTPCGLYSATLTSPFGCETTEKFSVACVNMSSTPSCPNTENDGAVSVNITVFGSDNGIEGNMLWSTDDQTPFVNTYQTTYSNLSPGDYHYSVTDNWGNLITNNATVYELSEIAITTIVTAPVFAGESPGSVTISFDPASLTGYVLTIESIEDPSYETIIPDPQSPIVLSIENAGDYLVTLSYPNSNCPDVTNIFNMPLIKPLDATISLTPSTCDRYSGIMTISITYGWPPYTIAIVQDGIVVLTNLVFDEAGTYSIELNNLNSMNVLVAHVTDYYNDHQAISETPSYAWNLTDDIVTSSNIEPSYTDRILCIGTASDQTLNLLQNTTFTNCEIYCATHYYSNVSETQWTLAAPYDLILDNCEIQSGCPDQMWQGIKVMGNNSTQSFSTHASATITNSTIISDAMCAFESKLGGIIIARNSYFYNNKYDLYFNSFAFNHTYSKIESNDFITNAKLNNPYVYPSSHVYLNRVRTLSFKGNDFINEMPFNSHAYVETRGIGIFANLSSFIITPTSILNPSEVASANINYFTGLYYGVKVNGQYSTAPKIQHSVFTNNYRGVKLTGTTGARAIYNTFYNTEEHGQLEAHGYPVNNTIAYDATYAAYIDRATNTWFEENKIFNGQAGAYVYNTGAAGTRFYRNNFGRDGDNVNFTPRGMDAATVVVGTNSDFVYGSEFFIGETGLQVRCNDYTANDFAISVFNGNMRVKQGENYTGVTTDKLAGNQFHSTLVNGIEFNVNVEEEPGFLYDYSDLAIDGNYEYNQHNDAISADQNYNRELTYYSEGVSPYTLTNIPFNYSTSCPSNFGLHHFNHGTAISDIAARKSQSDSKQAQYNRVVDRGNTTQLKTVAESVNRYNYLASFIVLSNNGYLSDIVFEALINNQNSPNAATTAILIVNSPLPEKIKKMVYTCSLPTWQKALILFVQNGENNRVKLENEISGLNQEIFDIESELVNNAINNDSTNTVIDATLNYYNQKSNKDYNDYINIYKLNLSADNPVNAGTTLSQIRSFAATQTPEIAVELITFCDVNEVYLDYMSEEHGDTSLLVQNKEMLFEAARSTSSLYSATAEILYSYTTDSSFYEYTPMPFEVMTPRSVEVLPDETELFKPQINVYPNPSDGLVFVDYNFAEHYTEGYELIYKALGIEQKDNCEHGEIRVYTNDAKLLQTIPLNALAGMITIDIRSYTPGTYLLEIADCFGNAETVKITKTY